MRSGTGAGGGAGATAGARRPCGTGGGGGGGDGSGALSRRWSSSWRIQASFCSYLTVGAVTTGGGALAHLRLARQAITASARTGRLEERRKVIVRNAAPAFRGSQRPPGLPRGGRQSPAPSARRSCPVARRQFPDR